MHESITRLLSVVALLVPVSWSAQAFECPDHFDEVQALIDKASEGGAKVKDEAPLDSRAHLRHARMSLNEARYHHGQAGSFHHARAIVRAGEARGHAMVADFMDRGTAGEHRFDEVRALIDKAGEAVKHMKNGMPIAARSHLRHAVTSLDEARHHYAQSESYHRARAIIREEEARAHAIVAYIMSQGVMSD